MRIWSLHPKFLDSKGLVACWRETLLAKNVLLGLTKGYKNHPQLIRFRKCEYPIAAIDNYLYRIWQEAYNRGYDFDIGKITHINSQIDPIPVNYDQVFFELQHLMLKLSTRDRKKWQTNNDELLNTTHLTLVHPIFKVVDGPIEDWEKV